MNKRNHFRARLLSAACLIALGFAALPAMASTFRLQSTTVVMDERDGRTTFNVTNTGSDPILLLTKLEDLGNEEMAKNVLVTPAVTRIDPDQSQIINFALKQGVKLDQEYMLKASFEGVEQRVKSGTSMPVRQQIGFIVQPKSVAVEPQPWKELAATISGNQLTLSNPGKHIVRLGPVVKLPSGEELPLSHAYILPGQSVSVTHEGIANANQISITPLSRYGLVLPATSLPIAR
jgi:fimbrial chaperone protein